MKGPLGKLVVAGKKGAYSGNIQRDMMRTVQKLQGFDYVHGDVAWLYIEIWGIWVLTELFYRH